MMWIFLLACSARRTEPIVGPIALGATERSGEHVFFRECHQCHPYGEGGVGFSLNDKPLPAFAIRTQVRVGFGEMPAFGRGEIDDAEMDALLAYLKRLRSGGSALP